jgi:glycosyltransferase 2 family protein
MHKKYILIVIKSVVTIALFLLVSKNVDLQKIYTILDSFEIIFFLLAIAILMLQTIIAAVRWRIILRKLIMHFSFNRVLGFLWIGLFFNQALPSNVGGDAFRGYCIFKNGHSVGKSSLCILLDRMFGMTGLIIFLILSLPLMFDLISDNEIQWGVIVVVTSAFAIICLSLMLDLLPKKIAHFKVVKGLFAFSKEGRKQMFSIYPGVVLIAISMSIHLISIAAVIVLSKGMSLDFEWYSMLFVIPFTILASAIPISIAGWGVRESVMIVSLGYLGIAPEQALVLSILYGLIMLVVSIPGLVFWLRGKHSIGDK